ESTYLEDYFPIVSTLALPSLIALQRILLSVNRQRQYFGCWHHPRRSLCADSSIKPPCLFLLIFLHKIRYMNTKKLCSSLSIHTFSTFVLQSYQKNSIE